MAGYFFEEDGYGDGAIWRNEPDHPERPTKVLSALGVDPEFFRFVRYLIGEHFCDPVRGWGRTHYNQPPIGSRYECECGKTWEAIENPSFNAGRAWKKLS